MLALLLMCFKYYNILMSFLLAFGILGFFSNTVVQSGKLLDEFFSFDEASEIKSMLDWKVFHYSILWNHHLVFSQIKNRRIYCLSVLRDVLFPFSEFTCVKTHFLTNILKEFSSFSPLMSFSCPYVLFLLL